MSSTISTRKSMEVTGGGRGGAGNAASSSEASREYVDGGLYRSGVAGEDGLPYSTGRGGAGNMGEGKSSTSRPASMRDEYARESVLPPREGETASGGRGGAGNIGEIKSQDRIAGAGSTHHGAHDSQTPVIAEGEDGTTAYGTERNPQLEKRRLSSGMSHLGLADKLKFGMMSMMKKS